MITLWTVSTILGWIYTAAWTVSFYPQLYLNYRLQDVEGLSGDYVNLNVVGFAALAVANALLRYHEATREEYKSRHDGHSPQVRGNDIFFALHAAIITSITLFQYYYYRRETNKIHPLSKILVTVFAGTVVVTIFNATVSSHGWILLTYSLMYIKLVVSTVKAIPQVITNYKRRSTVGWSISNIWLDIVGSTLSFAQLTLDCYLDHDWTGLTGNPGKLGLSLLSLSFDVVFILQHYVFYRDAPVHLGDNDAV